MGRRSISDKQEFGEDTRGRLIRGLVSGKMYKSRIVEKEQGMYAAPTQESDPV